ncbi:MAG: hypothetical protein ACYDIA_04135 [Candidatus Humimicrobiaceae bacterium]
MEDKQKDIIFTPAKEQYDKSIRPELKTLRVRGEIGIRPISEYSDSLVYLFIEKIKVSECGELEFQFKSFEWLHVSKHVQVEQR